MCSTSRNNSISPTRCIQIIIFVVGSWSAKSVPIERGFCPAATSKLKVIERRHWLRPQAVSLFCFVFSFLLSMKDEKIEMEKEVLDDDAGHEGMARHEALGRQRQSIFWDSASINGAMLTEYEAWRRRQSSWRCTTGGTQGWSKGRDSNGHGVDLRGCNEEDEPRSKDID
ncbi:hypothetical protein DL96DRAFT_789167 [Flagelloscypha sp. PMI_526]|nr:hypothetical protein DL96DRAFT_789167 [Flagelloscypha sp. PMI_526]